jgi:hypothetical protein
MTTDDKLTAILAAVQTDPGNRGSASDPVDNLFTACPGDFAAACRGLAEDPRAAIFTGFFIPSSDPPAFETDGPLGAVFLWRAMVALTGCHEEIWAEPPVRRATDAAIDLITGSENRPLGHSMQPSHDIWIERAGAASDGRCYTMLGRDITDSLSLRWSTPWKPVAGTRSIGIGDGGNEVGMGKIPHGTIVKNIHNGDLIHCCVPTDHLIVAGVSNWGAYALAAGVYLLRGVKAPGDLFDPDREREILEVMVREGPLVDGVTGRQTATVDGLSWEDYVKPLIRIREILAP